MVKNNISFLRNGLGGCGVPVPCGISQWEDGNFKPSVAGIHMGCDSSLRAIDPWHPEHIHHPCRLPRALGEPERDEEN